MIRISDITNCDSFVSVEIQFLNCCLDFFISIRDNLQSCIVSYFFNDFLVFCEIFIFVVVTTIIF